MRSKVRNESGLTRREWLGLTAAGTTLPALAGWPVAAQAATTAPSKQVIELLSDQRLATISPGLFGNLIEAYGTTLGFEPQRCEKLL